MKLSSNGNVAVLSILFGFLHFHLMEVVMADGSCEKDRLTVYRVIMNTYWSRELFPKHYPDWRPKAQFSKLVGRSHNENYKLFSLNERASDALKIFAETGQSDLLDRSSQGGGGVYDEFNAPPVGAGVGQTEAQFFVDGNHSMVSLMSRIIPSPDWFIGVDSVDLCNRGTWLTSLIMQADPIDSGTDNGLTFTAPNWPTEPRGLVTKLTTRHPNHPASSFFDSDRESLPPIASFHFFKVKEYELSQVFNHPATTATAASGTEFQSNDVFDYKVHPLHQTQTNFANLKFGTIASSSSFTPSNSNKFKSKSNVLEKKEIIRKNNKEKKTRKLRHYGSSSPNCGVNSWCSRRRRHNHHVLFNWERR